MNSRELHRIRFVTRHFAELRGLQSSVPQGLCALGLGLVILFFEPAAITFSRTLFELDLLIVLVSLGLWLRARTYYRQRFGQVEPQGFALRLWIGGAYGFVVVWITGYLFFMLSPPETAQALLALTGVSCLLDWLLSPARSIQPQKLVLGMMLGLLAAVIPLPLQSFGLTVAATGFAFILNGLLDHWKLTRFMSGLAEVPAGDEPEAVEIQARS